MKIESGKTYVLRCGKFGRARYSTNAQIVFIDIIDLTTAHWEFDTKIVDALTGKSYGHSDWDIIQECTHFYLLKLREDAT
jgi:hypothetical protein